MIGLLPYNNGIKCNQTFISHVSLYLSALSLCLPFTPLNSFYFHGVCVNIWGWINHSLSFSLDLFSPSLDFSRVSNLIVILTKCYALSFNNFPSNTLPIYCHSCATVSVYYFVFTEIINWQIFFMRLAIMSTINFHKQNIFVHQKWNYAWHIRPCGFGWDYETTHTHTSWQF